jgi:sialate O-acetylesterase
MRKVVLIRRGIPSRLRRLKKHNLIMKSPKRLFSTLPLLLAGLAHGELRLSNVFSDHMVLQQEMPIRIWGWADPGAGVEVAMSDLARAAATKVKAGPDGKWMATLVPQKAQGKVWKIRVKSGEELVELEDVLMGEVWICSGQSNMEWSIQRSAKPKEEIAAANHPKIRMFNVPKHLKQNEPQADAQKAVWQVCSPQTIAGFSAVGYHFGKNLHKSLDIPIGLVGANWGGTRIEPWTPPVGFKAVPELKDYVDQLAQKKYKGGATQIYNGMVAGLTPLSVRGAVWYQGESNAGDGLRYEFLKYALVKGWREVFQNKDLSFYWVQLADFGRGHAGKPEGGGWGPVREGQRRALALEKTGMAVIMDIGHESDIHPRNKQDVGYRLAQLALAKDYGKKVVPCGPLYKSHKVTGNSVVVSFDHIGGGLMTGKKEGEHRMDPVKPTKTNEVLAFSLRDESGAWHFAKAVIKGDTVVVSSDAVKKPTAVRYAYDSDPDVNLYNKEGLPASPFTTVD